MKIFNKKVATIFSIVLTTFSFSQQNLADETSEITFIDPPYKSEVLAASETRDGQGYIEILGDIDGVTIVRSFPIGYRYAKPQIAHGLPKADQLAIIYQDMTGKELPKKAFQALQNVETQKAKNTTSDSVGDIIENKPVEPSTVNSCTNTHPEPSNFFSYDCYGYGYITRTEYGVDDNCLLVAAISGGVNMRLAYKAINGYFYNNHTSYVSKGHYRAVERWSWVKRTRLGRIYNATNDYRRFNYSGDRKVIDFSSYGYPLCNLIAN